MSLNDITPSSMNKMRNLKLAIAGAVTLLGLIGCSSTGSHAKATKTAEEVMGLGFKGKDPALKGSDTIAGRIRAGTATDADLKLMVELTRQLTLNKPSKGELASWVEKTTALHAAAKALASHQPGAADAWGKAVNCKACHSAHKPD